MLQGWFNADRLVSFAHVQGPLRFEPIMRADVVKTLRDAAAASGEESNISYMLARPNTTLTVLERLGLGDASTPSTGPEVAVQTIPQDLQKAFRKYEGKPAILVFDVQEEWDAAFCAAMIDLSCLCERWASARQHRLHVVWLSSAPWDPLFSRIMSIHGDRGGVSTMRMRLPAARESVDRLRWAVYGSPFSEEGQLTKLARRIVEDHAALPADDADRRTTVLVVGPHAEKLRSAIRLASNDTEETENIKVAVIPRHLAHVMSQDKTFPPVRHLVLGDTHLDDTWSPCFSQVVVSIIKVPSMAAIRDQVAMAYADGVDPAQVTVHAPVSRDKLHQAEHPRRFEDIHMASIIALAFSKLPRTNLDRLKRILSTDNHRWETAVHRLQLAGFVQPSDLHPGGFMVAPVERAARTAMWLPHVDYDFSIAHFLAANTAQTSLGAFDAILDIGAILVAANRRGQELVGYDRKRHPDKMRIGIRPATIAQDIDNECYGIPPGVSATGSLWITLGLYRRTQLEHDKGTIVPGSHSWTPANKWVTIDLAVAGDAIATRMGFKEICVDTATAPLSDRRGNHEMAQGDVDFVRTTMLECWIHRLIYADYKETFSDGMPHMFAPWTCGVYVHALSMMSGFFAGESYSAEPNGEAFIIGTSSVGSQQGTFLNYPTWIPAWIIKTWMADHGLQLEHLRPPQCYV
ncbi:hypothetical protein QIS74_11195 [Colletotrichum tabaci]|uniref:Uncharacterized protein n=1 Tax=Colletotrichum tabaci TaxID=1209068 RepID=A0AAV9SXW1_9PEZI